MVLDTATLRTAFGLMTLALVFLFYFCTYRPARSPYSGWWCVALLFFLTGSLCFLLNRTDHQVWANPLGNTLLVTGALAVWAGARSLRPARPPKSAFIGIPLLILVASALDDPATNTWSGGPLFLAFMSLAFGLTSHELWRLDREYSQLRIPMAVSSAGLAVFYVSGCSSSCGGPGRSCLRYSFRAGGHHHGHDGFAGGGLLQHGRPQH